MFRPYKVIPKPSKKHLGSHNAMKHKQLLGLSSWTAEDDLIRSKHVALTKYTSFVYEGESKSKGKIHLTALIEVTVSNFTYHFST